METGRLQGDMRRWSRPSPPPLFLFVQDVQRVGKVEELCWLGTDLAGELVESSAGTCPALGSASDFIPDTQPDLLKTLGQSWAIRDGNEVCKKIIFYSYLIIV